MSLDPAQVFFCIVYYVHVALLCGLMYLAICTRCDRHMRSVLWVLTIIAFALLLCAAANIQEPPFPFNP